MRIESLSRRDRSDESNLDLPMSQSIAQDSPVTSLDELLQCVALALLSVPPLSLSMHRQTASQQLL
ncbi:hypothetical protein [[Phormidium] sp. ETS-05]|uniref:hypothetical protein n=1 Tax=[Phormidium] sp. ETS-05 TaxID=222819 RepID=UPI001E444748|nr:hypothetical protein [[Phormidium] sp. ETS-05]